VKRVARTEDETIVTIPNIVGVGIVGVEPELGIVAINIEHIEVAVGVLR
jgi:hypothetical protein